MPKKTDVMQLFHDESQLLGQSFKEPEKEPRFTVKVVSVSKVSQTLILELRRPSKFTFKAGQYVWLLLTKRTGEPGIIDRRPYSLASKPDSELLELVIRITESDYLRDIQNLKSGDTVEIIGPFGSSFIPPKEGAILISGGTGISPFLSLLRSGAPGHFTLFAYEDKERPLHCREEVLQFGKTGNDVLVNTGAPETTHFLSLRNTSDKRPIFISGREGFVTTISKLLHQIGIDAHRLRYEACYPMTEERDELRKIFKTEENDASSEESLIEAASKGSFFDKALQLRKNAKWLLTTLFLPLLISLLIISGIDGYIKYKEIAWVHIVVVLSFVFLFIVRFLSPRYVERINIGITGLFFLSLLAMRNEPIFAEVTYPWIVMFPAVTRLFLSIQQAMYVNSFFFFSVILVEILAWSEWVALPPLPNAGSTILVLALISLISQTLAKIESEYGDNLKDQLTTQGNIMDALRNALRLSDMFRLVAHQTSSHVVLTDSAGRVLYANKAAEHMTGFTLKEMFGQTPRLWGGLMPSEYYDKLWRDKSHGHPVTSELINRRKDGVLYSALARLTPLARGGHIIGYVATEEDISHIKKVDKTKTEFVSLASHQLRTPLSAIGWFSEMLLSGDAGKVTKTQREYLEEIHNGNRRMTELVNALLNVSRLELGTFMIEPRQVDIQEFVQSVISELKPFAEQKKQKLMTSFSSEIPPIMMDSVLLRMVFQNLVSNAIKYTPEEGRIDVVLSLDHNKRNFVFRVEDTGWGIPKKEQDRVFTKLFRADNIKEKDVDGTGLGLYIVKSIVDQSGGTIAFQSSENKGTVFIVTFPLSGMKERVGSKTLEVGQLGTLKVEETHLKK